ncbi:uncharacterized protein BX664DRAFT_387938 [Halteromyces radiatus]|uniref:uncharacterized protein n=1 Tax=Halteromyces radiatus TaxID=101107 RepID=UPI0022211648|nr:uncharacterized protein BX664DRAFT_387938 [Halteromyces radiatus]KAI8082795.1 hypothetical protein BX664DRAFT_387938 [Halteromyces radiatus]
MDYSSYNPYQHYRKKSPTTYDNIIDPYRRHTSRPSDTNTIEQEVLHSRTASDSSTSRLATNGITYTSREYDDDPYAISKIPNNNNNNNKEDNNDIHTNNNKIPTVNPYHRANSYLPYSHHQRDPTQQIAPIYVEDDQQQSIQGVGSMLHDTFSVDMTTNEIRRQKTTATSDSEKRNKDFLLLIDQQKKKNNVLHRRCYGMTGRNWFIVITTFLVLFTLLMYFLIPRMPTVTFSGADTTQRQTWSLDRNTMTAQWTVNMTLDNSQNWIPLWLQEMYVEVADNDTLTMIGSGMAQPTWLSPRNSQQLINIPINISYTGKNVSDETISDLFATCGPQISLPGPSFTKPELFNITFDIDLRIQGVPWSSHTIIEPSDGIQCPA